MDIGMKLAELDAAQQLYLFIPFPVDKSSLCDLGQKLTESRMLNAVFNENYSIEDIPLSKHWRVKDEKGTPLFYLYTLDMDQDIQLSSFGGGTILSIPTRNIILNGSPSQYYLRFRINGPAMAGRLIRLYQPKNSWLQSTVSTMHTVNFRFNYRRSLSLSLIEKFHEGQNGMVKIKALHFLLMTRAHIDVVTGQPSSSMRELEEGLWDNYVGDQDTSDIVAYHCKKKAENQQEDIGDWEFFGRLKTNKSTLRIISYYLFWLGIITVFFNLLSTWISTFFLGW